MENMKKKSEKEKQEEILEELYKQYPIDEMVKFDEFSISEKLQDNSYWIVHFRNELLKVTSEYEQLEEMLETLIGQRYDYYRFDYDKELDKTEIKNYYIPKDQKIRKMKRILARQKVKVEFFKYCVAGMEKQQWNMKNFLENLKVNV
jgi:hypothetical protein